MKISFQMLSNKQASHEQKYSSKVTWSSACSRWSETVTNKVKMVWMFVRCFPPRSISQRCVPRPAVMLNKVWSCCVCVVKQWTERFCLCKDVVSCAFSVWRFPFGTTYAFRIWCPNFDELFTCFEWKSGKHCMLTWESQRRIENIDGVIYNSTFLTAHSTVSLPNNSEE